MPCRERATINWWIERIKIKVKMFSWQNNDPFTKNLPLMGSPLKLCILTALYLIFVLKWGPAFMKNRPAYKLREVLMVYNLLQVIGNFCFCSYTIYTLIIYRSFYDFACCVPLAGDSFLKPIETALFYIYFLFKVVDYLDTVFIVLRKSYRQVTFLHLYHHVSMVVVTYAHLHIFGPGGHHMNLGVVNTFVHFVMYSYYFLTVYRPEMKQSIWWKKHLTELQLLQFVLLLLHHGYPLLFRRECKYPKVLLHGGVLLSVVMMVAFGNFYRNTYLRKEQKSTKKVTSSKVQ